MRTLSLVAVFAAVLSMACGPAARVFKGTSTTTFTSNGSTGTETVTGATLLTIAGSDLNELVIYGVAGGATATATLSGTTLAIGNSTLTTTGSNTTSTVSLTGGSGTLQADQLTLNLTGTQTQTSTAGTGTASFTYSFSGARE